MNIDEPDFPDLNLPDNVAVFRQRPKSPFRDPQITILWDDKRYNDDLLTKFRAIMEAESDIWYIEARDSKGREMLMFRGCHP